MDGCLLRALQEMNASDLQHTIASLRAQNATLRASCVGLTNDAHSAAADTEQLRVRTPSLHCTSSIAVTDIGMCGATGTAAVDGGGRR